MRSGPRGHKVIPAVTAGLRPDWARPPWQGGFRQALTALTEPP